MRQADVREEASEHVGVTSCGRGVAVSVKVKREEPEPLIGPGEVNRPRALRSSRADRAIAVLVRDRTVGVDDSHAHTRSWAHRYGERPRRAVRAMSIFLGRRYDGTTFRVRSNGYSKGRVPPGVFETASIYQVAKLKKIRHLASAPASQEAGVRSLCGWDRQLLVLLEAGPVDERGNAVAV